MLINEKDISNILVIWKKEKRTKDIIICICINYLNELNNEEESHTERKEESHTGCKEESKIKSYFLMRRIYFLIYL